ncbi:MAG: cytochrome c3 family protein [Pseudomonadota bacterium]
MIAKRILSTILVVAALGGGAHLVLAAQQTLAPDRIADVLNTKHNFAAFFTPKLPTGAIRAVEASTQNETCVFCHTPHAATISAPAQLWNRGFSAATYTLYSSGTMEAVLSATDLGVGSKMCLSCHDGTIALGKVNAVNGVAATSDITFKSGVTTMPDGSGANSGDTRNIGSDLRNDHPIAVEYSATVAGNDGELHAPGAMFYQALGTPVVGARNKTVHTYPAAPLETVNAKDTLQCTTCHDPHIRGTGADENVNIKFLRLNRFQKADPVDGIFSVSSDQQCLACHNKTGWANSAHAKSTATPYTYIDSAADKREFPHNTNMWEAGCLNCHDTHTVAGAPYLLREGASGGNSATENTCYQCHGAQGASALNVASLTNIESAFLAGTATSISLSTHGDKIIATSSAYGDGHAPAKKNVDLGNGTTVATGGNLAETQSNLKTNRHVECADCHHPHRVQAGTHSHVAGTAHTNAVAGVLIGNYGVEPLANYAGTFTPYDTTVPMTYTVKQGNTGSGTEITKEYQVCVKCHSSYSLDNTQIGATNKVTNVAAEFLSGTSKHPVMAGTGGSGAAAGAFVAPFNQALGTQTMYCSDCHEPHSGKMKMAGDALCYDCHSVNSYGNTGASVSSSGFSCSVAPCVSNAGATAPSNNATTFSNLHVRHAQLVTGYRCNDCHTKQMHGWKLKAFLVDINAVSSEVADVPGAKAPGYTYLPYYDAARLQISGGVAANAGSWTKASCGASGCHVLPN